MHEEFEPKQSRIDYRSQILAAVDAVDVEKEKNSDPFFVWLYKLEQVLLSTEGMVCSVDGNELVFRLEPEEFLSNAFQISVYRNYEQIAFVLVYEDVSKTVGMKRCQGMQKVFLQQRYFDQFSGRGVISTAASLLFHILQKHSFQSVEGSIQEDNHRSLASRLGVMNVFDANYYFTQAKYDAKPPAEGVRKLHVRTNLWQGSEETLVRPISKEELIQSAQELEEILTAAPGVRAVSRHPSEQLQSEAEERFVIELPHGSLLQYVIKRGRFFTKRRSMVMEHLSIAREFRNFGVEDVLIRTLLFMAKHHQLDTIWFPTITPELSRQLMQICGAGHVQRDEGGEGVTVIQIKDIVVLLEKQPVLDGDLHEMG